MLRKVFKVSFLLCLLAAPIAALAQNTASVHGSITDPDGAVIPGAIVTLQPASGAALHATAGNDGGYTVRNVPAGTYTLTVAMNGFATFSQANVRVAAGQSVDVEAKLAIATESQVVQVTADSSTLSVDSDNNASATVIEGKDLDALSDDPDELEAELLALAGPAAGPNGGQIYIDGFTGGQLPPKSSIREIRINQNPFSAEYDRPGFGRVEIFTKPGTDKFHGNISAQGNSSAFNTSNPLLNISATTGQQVLNPITQPPYHTIFFVGSLTGPLTKLSSFSIGGQNRQIIDNSIIKATIWAPTSTSTTLCNPGDQTCTISTFNLAAPTTQNLHNVTPRLDLQLGAKNTLTTRFGYFNTNSSASGGGLSLNTTGSSSSGDEYTIQASDTQTVTQRIINETRFEWQRNTSTSTPTSTAPSISVQGNFNGGGAGGTGTNSNSQHYEIQNYTSVQLAKNFVRMGGRWRYSNESITSGGNTTGGFLYANLTDPSGSCAAPTVSSYQCGIVSQYSITKIVIPTLAANMQDIGLYLEDDWKARPNLQLSYGIRYEKQFESQYTNSQTGKTGSPFNDTLDFAPRASFAWGLFAKKGNPKVVVRGGAGIFYDRFNLGNVYTLIQNNGVSTEQFLVENPSTACTPSTQGNCTVGAAAGGNSTTVAAPTLRAPYVLEYQIGFDEAPFNGARLSLNYVRSNGEQQFYKINANAPASGIATPGAPVINTYESGGIYRQNQLNVNFSFREKWYSISGYNSISFANADTSGFNSAPTVVSQGIVSNYGRASFDIRDQAFFSGSISLPHYISLNPLMQFRTGSPYNITVGQDLNGDTYYNDRPRFATSSDSTSSVKTIAGCGSFFAPSAGTNFQPIPVNYCTAANLFALNMRIAKTWGFGPSTAPRQGRQGGQGGPGGGGPGGPPGGGGPGGGGGGGARGGGGGGGGRGGGGGSTGKRYNLSLSAQIQNIFNTENLAPPQSSMASAAFGVPTQLAGSPYGTSSAKQKTTLQMNFSF